MLTISWLVLNYPKSILHDTQLSLNKSRFLLNNLRRILITKRHIITYNRQFHNKTRYVLKASRHVLSWASHIPKQLRVLHRHSGLTKQRLRSEYQATTQRQAHLQFARKPRTNQKLQKSLPFLPPHLAAFVPLDSFLKTPPPKKIKTPTAFVPWIKNKMRRQDFNLTKYSIFDM